MTTDVVSVAPGDTVDEAARLLTFHEVSGLPVCDAGRVVGVLSEADLIGKSGSTVGDVMTAPALTVSESTTLERVAELLTQQRIRRVPVVGPGGNLVGIVARHDVLVWASRRVAGTSPQS
ncbi:MAG: CBS domain-containing protein [Chloroflexi bacterium]|nr:CBS domain-containing protein [Chloroflexota bacterium]